VVKYLFLIISAIIISFSSSGQCQEFQSLIPAGFAILDSASGDINKDGSQDLVMILKNSEEEIIAGAIRPLHLLTGD